MLSLPRTCDGEHQNRTHLLQTWRIQVSQAARKEAGVRAAPKGRSVPHLPAAPRPLKFPARALGYSATTWSFIRIFPYKKLTMLTADGLFYMISFLNFQLRAIPARSLCWEREAWAFSSGARSWGYSCWFALAFKSHMCTQKWGRRAPGKPQAWAGSLAALPCSCLLGAWGPPYKANPDTTYSSHTATTDWSVLSQRSERFYPAGTAGPPRFAGEIASKSHPVMCLWRSWCFWLKREWG